MHNFHSNIKYSNRVKNNNTDVLFDKQQLNINKAKKDKLNLLNVHGDNTNDETKIEKITFHPSFFSSWELNSFDSDLIFREETPLISNNNILKSFIENKWDKITVDKNSDKNIQGKIYRSIGRPNMKSFSVKMQTTFTMKGDSTVWIFNRVNDYFDEYTVSIKLEKIENSQRVFCSLGTFVKDTDNNLIFKNFIREQLIDYSSTKKNIFSENDMCYIKGIILDTCDDKVVVRLKLNESNRENIIFGNFYLPICEDRRVMIAGTGMNCHIKSFTVSNVDIEEMKEEEKLFAFEDGIDKYEMKDEDGIEGFRQSYCCNIF